MAVDLKEFKFWTRLMDIETMTLSPNPHEANNAVLLVNKILASHGLTRNDWPPRCRRYFKTMGIKHTVHGRRKFDIGRRSHTKKVWLNVLKEALIKLGGEAKLEDLYVAVKQSGVRCKTSDILKSQVRDTLQMYSSDAKKYKPNAPDAFRKVRKGVWGVRNYPL